MLERIDRYKAALDAARPFQDSLLQELRDYYKIGLTWSSNALEGNTLTVTETGVKQEPDDAQKTYHTRDQSKT